MKKTKAFLTIVAAMLFAVSGLFADTVVTFDGLARIRYEYLLNNGDAGNSGKDEKSYFRFKFSGGVNADFGGFASVYGRLTTESRSYLHNAGGKTEYDINEAVIDNIYVLFPKLFGAFEVKAGRFDLSGRDYGGGFLIEDGTPLDGSRTFYFNGAKIAYKGQENSIEFISVYNSAFDAFPVINDKDSRLNSGDEAAAIVYGRVKANENMYLEPYYIWKQENKAAAGKIYDEKSQINTFGSYVKYDLKALSLTAQAAAQIGDYGDEFRSGFGGNVFAGVKIKNIFDPLKIGYTYLSGDDSSTGRQEAWNPLFSRGPQMSEIVASLYSSESGYGYWTNLQALSVEANASLLKKLSAKFVYSYMAANETLPEVTGGIFGGGKTRGSLFLCKFVYDISKEMKASLHGEYFMPGNFYYDGAEDAVFVRAEFSAKI